MKRAQFIYNIKFTNGTIIRSEKAMNSSEAIAEARRIVFKKTLEQTENTNVYIEKVWFDEV